jgi:hypothetical protein
LVKNGGHPAHMSKVNSMAYISISRVLRRVKGQLLVNQRGATNKLPYTRFIIHARCLGFGIDL